MKYQTDLGLNPDFEHVGCAFDSTAYARPKFGGPDWTDEELNAAWSGSIAGGILSPNFVIQDWQALATYLRLPLRFVGSFDVGNNFDRTGKYIVTEWYNPRTKFKHFVVGDQRPVEWDSIEGGSVTVREGYPISYRVFEVLGVAA